MLVVDPKQNVRRIYNTGHVSATMAPSLPIRHLRLGLNFTNDILAEVRFSYSVFFHRVKTADHCLQRQLGYGVQYLIMEILQC